MSEQQQDRPLWERQPWDTDAGFARFQKYYLPQPPPRSLPKAYRDYLVEKGKKTVEEQQAVQPNGHWLNWFYGKDTDGRPIPGAVDWRVRARAYDDHIWAERREWYKRQSWEVVDLAMEQAKEMIKHPLVRQRVKQQDESGRTVVYEIVPTNWRKGDAAKLLQTADRMARLDLGEPTDRTAVSGGADYSALSDDQLNDAIYRLVAQSGTAATGNLISPAFGEGEPPENDHEAEFEEG